MGLSAAAIDGHIVRWEAELGMGNRPYRKHWPSRLFRHEPLQSAVQILCSGSLLSRNDAGGRIALDIAPEEIIGARDAAHGYVRLYFRPKTPTQYHIEGIRKPAEVFQNRHAPILVMMIFDARAVLVGPATRFSNGNMQSDAAQVFASEPEFANLPFGDIYHEGAFDPGSERGNEIKLRRCAEVLLPSPLRLDTSLEAVLCRSPAERTTLLYMLGDAVGRLWSPKIRVFNQPGIFESSWAYIDELNGSANGIWFKLHPRRAGGPVDFRMVVKDDRGRVVRQSYKGDLDPSRNWKVAANLQPGVYTVECMVENCLAYKASFSVDDLPF
jgi:hypothetical protein